MGAAVLGFWGCATACAPPPAEPLVELSEEERGRAIASARLGPPPPATTNRVADDPDARRFGQALFYEVRLSPEQVSCASCHPPDGGFGRGEVQISRLVRRHVPTLWNVGHQRWLTWDGHRDSLWAQVAGPLEHPAEMASDRLYLAHTLYADSALREAYERLFGPLPDLDDEVRFPPRGRPGADAEDPLVAAWADMAKADQDAIDDVLVNAAKALAAYQRQILSGETRFDVFAAGLEEGDPDKLTALDEKEQLGLKLFVGRAQCHMCHTGPLFSDREFHNIGLEPRPGSQHDIGRIAGVDRVLRDPMNARSRHSDDATGEAADRIRFLAATSEQEGQFKTPPLRNVALTAPYMHDGRFQTLEEVVRFYSELGETPPFGHREDSLMVLDLSDAEVDALAAFLRALTNPAFPAALVGIPPALGEGN